MKILRPATRRQRLQLSKIPELNVPPPRRGRGRPRGRGAARNGARNARNPRTPPNEAPAAARNARNARNGLRLEDSRYCGACREQVPIAGWAENRLGRPRQTCIRCATARNRPRRQQAQARAEFQQPLPPIRPTYTDLTNPDTVRVLEEGDPYGWIPINGVETVLYTDYGNPDVACDYCGALHWLEERTAVSLSALSLFCRLF
jgi:hypothetical protein